MRSGRRGVGAAGMTLTVAFCFAALWQCDNGATGVDACRAIEERRCELAVGCPGVTMASEDEVKQCRLFYRDQCLFGIADGQGPDEIAVNQCLTALDQARACHVDGEPASSCSDAPLIAAGTDPLNTGCDLLLAPQRLTACAFLVPPDTGEGGADGTGGGAAATGGSDQGGAGGG